MRDVRNLEIYNIAEDLVIKIKKVLEDFPVEEKFELTSQLRRTSVNVFSNISESYSCVSKKEFLKFLGYAYRSLKEVNSQLSFSAKVKYLKDDYYRVLKNIVFKLDRKMLKFIDYIEKDERFYK